MVSVAGYIFVVAELKVILVKFVQFVKALSSILATKSGIDISIKPVQIANAFDSMCSNPCGRVILKALTTLLACPQKATAVSIPTSVTTIGVGAFIKCGALVGAVDACTGLAINTRLISISITTKNALTLLDLVILI